MANPTIVGSMDAHVANLRGCPLRTAASVGSFRDYDGHVRRYVLPLGCQLLNPSHVLDAGAVPTLEHHQYCSAADCGVDRDVDFTPALAVFGLE
jgi:hypothetical protein